MRRLKLPRPRKLPKRAPLAKDRRGRERVANARCRMRRDRRRT